MESPLELGLFRHVGQAQKEFKIAQRPRAGNKYRITAVVAVGLEFAPPELRGETGNNARVAVRWIIYSTASLHRHSHDTTTPAVPSCYRPLSSDFHIYVLFPSVLSMCDAETSYIRAARAIVRLMASIGFAASLDTEETRENLAARHAEHGALS